MKTYHKIRIIGGLFFVLLASFPLHGYAQGNDPYRVKFNFDVDFSLRPIVNVAVSPYRFLAFVKQIVDGQGKDISQKSLSLLGLSPNAL
ncbi:MAG: hypothetical protein HY001_00200 [Candidatus Portnoybacteria bacterium]|nr:hypothetical protein [Candidatus Portnoybacteria bacterium]